MTTDSLSLIPSDASYWRVKVLLKDALRKTILSCFSFEGHM